MLTLIGRELEIPTRHCRSYHEEIFAQKTNLDFYQKVLKLSGLIHAQYFLSTL